MNAETGGGLTAEEREALSNAIGAKIDEQFDEGEKIDIDWAIIYAADAAEAFFAARQAASEVPAALVDAAPSPGLRWCEVCHTYGDHKTTRHPAPSETP